MILSDITLEQDAALLMLASRTLSVSRLAMEAMHGQPFDPLSAGAMLFEGVAALRVAFPQDVDSNTLRMMMIRTGLGAAFTRPPANDDQLPHPDGAA